MSNENPLPAQKTPMLLDRVRGKLRLKHYLIRTDEGYVNWITRFIFFHNKRHPKEMGGREIEAFLTHLAVERQVSASTQNQALNALVFLYQQHLQRDLGSFCDWVRAKRSQRLPVVLTTSEVDRLFQSLEGTTRLIAELLYGTGMRIQEGLRLRVKDVDFAMKTITVRDGKGRKDRITMLPQKLIPRLQEHLLRVAGRWIGCDLRDCYHRR